MKKIIALIVVVVAGLVLWFLYNTEQGNKVLNPSSNISEPSDSPDISAGDSIYDPARITKKMFGLYTSPGHSPVSPERFTGFHTGTDFETTPAEADTAVPVPAFCDGKFLLKEYASGYGGVAVQSCTLDNQPVTVIYGHLSLATIVPNVGQVINKGDLIGDLGKGYSNQTDGERKHLHLGIHKGTSVNILGYTSSGNLNQWLDPELYLNLPQSTDYQLEEGDQAKTFVYKLTSRVDITLDSNKYSPTGMDCEPKGVLGPISDVPAVASGQFSLRYEGLVRGGCTLQDGSWYAHIIIQ